MTREKKEELYKDIPDTPGVYLMKDKEGEILYIGKAADLKKRVKSYFLRPHGARIETMVQKISDIDYEKTDSALEALILEASLIKKHKPPFNVKEKDDKSFLWVKITDSEEYPRVLLARGTEKQASDDEKASWYGPFTSSSDIRNALRVLRKIFPFNTHKPSKIGKSKRSCMYAQIGLCPGTCTGDADKKTYKKNIEGLKKVLRGKRYELIEELKEKMEEASENQKFEEAGRLKSQVFALNHVQDVSLMSKTPVSGMEVVRIEGYDVSNISGTSSAGAMVVFNGEKPNKSQYRKFKIKTIKKQDDVGMMREVVERRLNHEEWPLPQVVLVDGGKPQVNAVTSVFEENGLSIPVIGIAKGAKRDKNRVVGNIPKGIKKETLIKVRDEAHRFALKYHKKLRGKKSSTNK